MNRPKITQEEALKLVAPAGITEKVFVLAIRGYYKDTMGAPGVNDIGLYDDAFIVFGPGYYQTFNGNTDPSKHKPGIAKLCPGLHYYKKGNHGISRPGGGYPAFRPNTPDEGLPVTRDGKVGVYRGIAINNHKGGYNSTSSEGCQTVYPDQWLEYQQTIYKLMTDNNQTRLPYYLIEN